MSKHRISYSTANGKEFAYCTCRFSTSQGTRQEVEAQVQSHEANVRVAQAALSSKTPSLKQQLNHYEKMSVDPEVSAYDRNLWRVLADELRHRLGLDPSERDSTGLW